MIVDYDFKDEAIMGKIIKIIFFHVVLSFPFIFLSWLYVLFVIGSYCYVFFKDVGAPQSVKEFRWKIRNIDMTFDQMIKELMKLDEQDPNDFEIVKKEMIDYIEQRKSSSKL